MGTDTTIELCQILYYTHVILELSPLQISMPSVHVCSLLPGEPQFPVQDPPSAQQLNLPLANLPHCLHSASKATGR